MTSVDTLIQSLLQEDGVDTLLQGILQAERETVPCPRCKTRCLPSDLLNEGSWDKSRAKDGTNEDGSPRYKGPYLSEKMQEQDHWRRTQTTGDVAEGRQADQVSGICLACCQELRGVSQMEYTTANGERIPPEWEQEWREQKVRMRRRWRKA